MENKAGKSTKSSENSTQEHADTAKGESQIREPRAEEHQDQQTNASEEEAVGTSPTNIFRGFAGTSSRIVQQAASILEEEIAAGIIAAKQVEKHFVDSSAFRLSEPNALMQRFRKDLHEVVDIVIDLLKVAVGYVDGLNQQTVTIRGVKQEADGDHKSSSDPLNTPMMSGFAKAGESIELIMIVENSNEEPTDESSFHSTDLVSSYSDKIPASQIVFRPASIIVGPHATEELIVAVNVPEETPAGVYSGLIQAPEMDQLRAVLVVQVDQA